MGLSEFLRKTFKDQTSRAKEAGQAILEYILVLIITVAIVLGLMYQFNDAFKQFLDSYFGDYIACLLETGELPALGGSGPNEGQCASPFNSFNVAAGATSGAGGSNPSNGDGSQNSSDNSSGDSDSSSSSGGRSARNLSPSRISSSGGTSNGESTVSSSSGNRPARQNLSSASSGAGGGGFESDSSEGGGGRRGRRIRRKTVIYLGDDYTTGDAKRKNQSPVVAKGKINKSSVTDTGLRKAQFKLEVPEHRNVAGEVGFQGLSLGEFIKYLIIGGIIIALFLFLGGQAMQIKKSWQKSD